jgi:hypothetical protein
MVYHTVDRRKLADQAAYCSAGRSRWLVMKVVKQALAQE